MEKLLIKSNGQWELVKAKIDEGKSDDEKRKARAARRGHDKMSEEELRNANHEVVVQSGDTKWRKPKSGEVPSKETSAFSDKQREVADETGSKRFMPKRGKAFEHTTGVSDKGHAPRHKHALKERPKHEGNIAQIKWAIKDTMDTIREKNPRAESTAPDRVLH